VNFYEWLMTQHGRSDEVGQFSRIVASNKKWPKDSWRLCILLRRYSYSVTELPPDLFRERRLLKIAHKEWRKKEVTP